MNKSESANNIFMFTSMCFSTLFIISNIISVKLIPIHLGVSFLIPLGLFLYPLTFLLSDFITEIFGSKKSKQMVLYSLFMTLIVVLVVWGSLQLSGSNILIEKSFKIVLGLGGLRFSASIIAYLVSQMLDIKLYNSIRKLTKGRHLWLRSNGSTWIAQLDDSIIVDFIFLYLGVNMDFSMVLLAILFSFVYKVVLSTLTTPLLYWLVKFSKKKLFNKGVTHE